MRERKRKTQNTKEEISVIQKSKSYIQENIKKIKKEFGNHPENEELLDLSEKLDIHRNKVKKRTIFFVCLIAILVLGMAIFYRVRVFHHYKILSQVERADDSATEYIRLSSGRTLKCNPNGVTCVNNSDVVQWNTTFNMQKPIYDVCETTVAVGDLHGSEIYLFDENGLTGHFDVEHTLAKVKVAKQGVVAAILEDGDVTWINVYDKNGDMIVKNKTSVGETGYPVDMDISSDGLKMMVSYLGVNNDNIETRVVFYNFSSVGRDQDDNMVNKVTMEGHVVPEVKFTKGNYAVAFREDGMTFFYGKRVPEERTSITFEHEIISTFNNENYIGVVMQNDNEEKNAKYKLEIYRTNGTKCTTQYFNMDYTGIKFADDQVIMYNGSDIAIYTVGGKKVFQATYEKPVTDVIKTGGFRRYVVITEESADTIRIRQ
ncbi:MAG: DUF5711 family protein [Muricoprocola sp.]